MSGEGGARNPVLLKLRLGSGCLHSGSSLNCPHVLYALDFRTEFRAAPASLGPSATPSAEPPDLLPIPSLPPSIRQRSSDVPTRTIKGREEGKFPLWPAWWSKAGDFL